MKGEPPARVRPLFDYLKNSPLQISKNQRTMPVKQAWPTLKTCHWQVFLTLRSADADQGLCPWSLVAFEKAPQNFMRPAALVFANVCVYEQNRCFPMTVNSGLDQIQALVAVTGLK